MKHKRRRSGMFSSYSSNDESVFEANMDHYASREKAGSFIVHNSEKTYPGSITLDMEVSNISYARNANDAHT